MKTGSISTHIDRIQDSPISHQLKDLPPAKLAAIKSANAALGNRYLDLAAQQLAKRQPTSSLLE